MLIAARTVLAWLVIVGLPGWLLCEGLRGGAGRARNLALSPVAGIGALYVAAHAVEAVGLPVTPFTAMPLCLLVSLAAWLATHRVKVADFRKWRPRIQKWSEFLTVLFAVAIGSAVWVIASHHSSILPNTDGMHHALFVSRIETLRSVDPTRVVSADGTAPGTYYPLALHIAAALVASLAGVPSGTALTVAVVLAAALALPLGILALARRLDPGARAVPRVAAVLAVLFTWFPYSPMVWGGVPTVVGMCLIPAVVDGLWPRQEDGSRLAVGLCVGVAAAGLFELHDPELIAAGVVAVVLVLTNGGVRRGAGNATLAVWLVAALTVAATGVTALKATLRLSGSIDMATLNGGNERLSGQATAFFSGSGLAMMEKLLSPPILALSIFGFAVCRLDKRCRGLGFVFLVWVILLLGIQIRVPGFAEVSTPWFQAPLRLSYYLALPLVIWAAVGLEKLGVGIGWGLQRIASGRPIRGGAGAGAAVLLAITVALQAPSAVAMTRDIYRRADLIGVDQLAAFNWLRTHVAKESRVLDTFDDGSGWMGILGYAQPLFATKPEQGGPEVWGDRWHLLTHAGQLATDSIDQAVVRKWHVRFAYTDSRHFPGTPPLAFTARTLESSPAYALVWSRGSVKIFRVLIPRTT